MTKEQAINIAVDWWADKLKAKAPHSNGANELPSILACLLVDDAMKDTSDNQLDIFKRELKSRIESDLNNRWREVYLGVDYHPTTNLRESAELAGISVFNFPYKTDMYIKWNNNEEYEVYVHDGYGAQREFLKN